MRKVDRYTDIEARQAFARGRRVTSPWALLTDADRFLWRQYLKGRGYRAPIAAKLWELPRKEQRAADVKAV